LRTKKHVQGIFLCKVMQQTLASISSEAHSRVEEAVGMIAST
jgi:hypothetical protein